MHRYQPVVHIIPVLPSAAPATRVVFPQTMFTTVTAYQNQKVRSIKKLNHITRLAVDRDKPGFDYT